MKEGGRKRESAKFVLSDRGFSVEADGERERGRASEVLRSNIRMLQCCRESVGKRQKD